MNEQFIDPVCGMRVEKASAAGTSTAGETTWYFCSTYCKARFDRDPEAFTQLAAHSGAPAQACGSCCRRGDMT